MPSLKIVNRWSSEETERNFYLCCSSGQWSKRMSQARPFSDYESMCKISDDIWFALPQGEWLEAFSHHPRIGTDIAALREKFKATKVWSTQEQSGLSQASEQTLKALQQGNLDYEKKFGHVFLICATGKSADEMLAALQKRLPRSSAEELKQAAIEQSKISHIRLKKLLDS